MELHSGNSQSSIPFPSRLANFNLCIYLFNMDFFLKAYIYKRHYFRYGGKTIHKVPTLNIYTFCSYRDSDKCSKEKQSMVEGIENG